MIIANFSFRYREWSIIQTTCTPYFTYSNVIHYRRHGNRCRDDISERVHEETDVFPFTPEIQTDPREDKHSRKRPNYRVYCKTVDQFWPMPAGSEIKVRTMVNTFPISTAISPCLVNYNSAFHKCFSFMQMWLPWFKMACFPPYRQVWYAIRDLITFPSVPTITTSQKFKCPVTNEISIKRHDDFTRQQDTDTL